MAGIQAAATPTYGVYPAIPLLSLVSFNPFTNPAALSPPEADHTLARPFSISPETYRTLLHVAFPIVIASVYSAAVRYTNVVNQRRNYQPWPISKTLPFFIFVLVHNIGLAIFSGWIFAGMLNAVRRTWPGWQGEYGLAGATDALCKLNGPRGIGSAATFQTDAGAWSFTDRSMLLAPATGEPDSTDVGRMWNEGLGFYGFLFYLSKFYEVVDTIVILAKGKKSSQLQTFHHAGAMLCMWAGIRYMSPPIWMFTFINSFLHTWMYAYYTLTALTIRVPQTLKRTLTFLQIVQIVFGASYAIIHLFIAYDIPVLTPVVFARNLSTLLPSAAPTISSAATSMATSADVEAWLKKLALRAAGEEGLAENVRNQRGETFGIDAVHAAQVEKAQEEIRYKLVTRRVHCLDTSGQVFAILLNALYLAPLAYLFIEFFVKNYLSRTKPEAQQSSTQENVKRSANEAVEAIEKRVKEALQDPQGGATEPPEKLKAELEEAKGKANQIVKDLNQSALSKSDEARRKIREKVMQDLKELKAQVSGVTSRASNKIEEYRSSSQKEPPKVEKGKTETSDEVVADAKEEATEPNGKVREAESETDSINKSEKSATIDDEVKDESADIKDMVDDKVEDAKEESGEAVEKVKSEEERRGDELLDALESEISSSEKEA